MIPIDDNGLIWLTDNMYIEDFKFIEIFGGLDKTYAEYYAIADTMGDDGFKDLFDRLKIDGALV